MTIFNAIINNNLEKVKGFIESGENTPFDLEPDVFESNNAKNGHRLYPRTVYDVAVFLRRGEISDYLFSCLNTEEKKRILLLKKDRENLIKENLKKSKTSKKLALA